MQKDLMHQILEEISPYIRYCEYNLNLLGSDKNSTLMELRETTSGSLSILQSKIDKVFNDAAKAKAKTMAEISWRGQKVQIPTEDVRYVNFEFFHSMQK